MEESEYQQLAARAFRRIQDAFENVDPDDADAFMSSSDVMTIAFRSGLKCVINTQRPTRQIWLAANARAWHFSYDPQSQRWMDDKGRGDELFASVRAIVKEHAKIDLSLTP